MNTQEWIDPYPNPIRVLGELLERAGTSVVQAAFDYSFFANPDTVRRRTPRYPNFARFSNTHYPGKVKRDRAVWQGREVTLDDNLRARMAWEWYTGRAMAAGQGYGLRHIWGHPWDPDAFTAGWNLCYMPDWIGMLTEDQSPFLQLREAIRQASFDLYFRTDPVCPVPAFVRDPGVDLQALLGGRPILLARPRTTGELTSAERVKELKKGTHQSWSNLIKAARAELGLPHEPFGTTNVASNSISIFRRMVGETGLSAEDMHLLLEELGGPS